VEAHRELEAKLRKEEEYRVVFNKTSHDVAMKRQALEAFKDAITVFREQMRVHQDFESKAQPHEVQMLKANYDMLTERLSQLEDSKVHLEKSLRSKVTFSRTLERDITNLKPDMRILKNKKDTCTRWLLQQGVKQARIEALLQQQEASDSEMDVDSLPHQNEANWLLMECTRNMAQELLANRPDGTFLVRPSRIQDQYALSIM